jgi:hypothetical protein
MLRSVRSIGLPLAGDDEKDLNERDHARSSRESLLREVVDSELPRWDLAFVTTRGAASIQAWLFNRCWPSDCPVRQGSIPTRAA